MTSPVTCWRCVSSERPALASLAVETRQHPWTFMAPQGNQSEYLRKKPGARDRTRRASSATSTQGPGRTRRHCRESATGLGPRPRRILASGMPDRGGRGLSGALLKGRFFKNKSLSPAACRHPQKVAASTEGPAGSGAPRGGLLVWGACALGAGINRGIARSRLHRAYPESADDGFGSTCLPPLDCQTSDV
jgi:hypothetical protein